MPLMYIAVMLSMTWGFARLRLSVYEIDEVLSKQECQYFVETTVWWSKPSMLAYSQTRDVPVRNHSLAVDLFYGSCKQAYEDERENLGVVDSTVILLIEDCYFGLDTIHKHVTIPQYDQCTEGGS